MTKIEAPEITFEKQSAKNFDWATFFLVVLLVGIGLVSIYSATSSAGMSSYFEKQVLFAAVGFAAMFAVMYIPEHILQINSYVIYIISIGLLVAVLLFGSEVYGTKGWLKIGFITLQPAEFAKLATILIIARHLSYKGKDIRSFRDLFTVVALAGLPILLILMEPELGSATVIIAILMGLLLWSGFDIFTLLFIISIPIVFILSLMGVQYYFSYCVIFAALAITIRKRIVLTVAAIGIIIGVGYASNPILDNLQPHQKKRIEVFLNPYQDPRGAGYNVLQSILAVGNGGAAGKGFLHGTQTQLRYIPKQWTDFIYSVPAEEFGFAGAVGVLGLLTLLILRAVKIATESQSKYFSLVAIGAATLLFYHSLINIGMAIGLMPVMGIPLPFLSSGGSSLIVNMILMGLLLNAYRTQRKPNA